MTGKIDAAKWYTHNARVPVSTLYCRCTVHFCSKEDGIGFGHGYEQQKCLDVSQKILFINI